MLELGNATQGGVAYFEYDNEAIEWLCERDDRLREVIETIGPVKREVHDDLFPALINAIVGQQISSKAQETVWNRIIDGLGGIEPELIMSNTEDELQGFGLSFRKVEYIRNAAEKVLDGSLNLEGLHAKSDDEVRRELSSLKGIGSWTAEMLMIFAMQRMDVVSYGDLAILRGMRMVYHHRKITPKLFAKYCRRYSPYGSVASLYLWEVAGGAIDGMKDYEPKKKK